MVLRMKYPAVSLSALLLLVTIATAAASDDLPGPNWNRAAAVDISETTASRETLALFYRLAREGRSDELLLEVRAVAAGTALPDPARDRVLHALALALGDFEPGVVRPDVLEYLGGVRARTRVPHEEHPGMGVPLYNIRAAAAGSLAEWERVEQAARAPDPADPFTDTATFILSLDDASGSALTRRIRQARDAFDPLEIESIVMSAADMPDSATASLVLAELSPAVLDSPAVQDRLLELLGNRDLGATAALVLARSGDPLILDRLAELAAEDGRLASRRASMAIDLYLATGAER